MRKNIALLILSLLVVAGFALARNIETTNWKLDLNNIELKSEDAELKNLERQYDKLLKDKQLNAEQFEKRLKQLEDERARLEAELVSKRQKEQNALRGAVYASEQPKPSGTCLDWMKAAGVTDIHNAFDLIMRESSCNPNAVNSSSGACGLGQQLPCGKWPHVWNDPIGGIIDMQNYVMARYGSWAGAVAHHDLHDWY